MKCYNDNSNQLQFPELSIRDIVKVFFRHKTKMIVFFVFVVLSVSIVTLLTPKSYQSVAKIMLKIGRENATLDPAVSIGNTLNISDSRETEIYSEIEVIKSREIMEKVVDMFGPDTIMNLHKSKSDSTAITNTLRDLAINKVMKNTVVESVRKTNVIIISFNSYDPLLAKKVVNAIISIYQQKHQSIHRPTDSYDFLENQTTQLNKEIIAAEDSLLILKNNSGILSVETQANNLIQRISSLQLEINQVNASLAASTAKINSLQSTLNNVPKILNKQSLSSSSSQSGELLKSKLNDLILKKEDYLTKYTRSSRIITDIEKQIEETAALLNRENLSANQSDASKEIQMSLIDEKINYSSLSAKKNSLTQMLNKSKDELVQFNKYSVDILRLKKQSEIDEKNYIKYSDNLEQARIDHILKASNITNISIVQSATLPVKPDKPKRLYNLLLAICFGVFGALSIAFVAEFLDHSIKSSDDITSFLKQPLIASVPYFDELIVRTRTFPQKSLNVFDNIGRTIHASFQSGGYSNVIGITSCYIGEGTSFIASRIADAMISFQDGDVLYADLNFDNPDLQNKLSFSSSQQSNNVRKFEADKYISQDNDNNQAHEIVVIPAGKQAHLPVQYVQRKRFDQFINFCTTKYTSIVFDMPPLSESTMVLEMAAHIDGLVLVIESGKVRREVVRQMIFDITQAGINIIGIVLNKQKQYIPQFIYNRI